MSDSNPSALFGYVAEQLNRFGLAYLHIVEPRVKGSVVIAEGQAPVATAQLRKIFKGKIVSAGGFAPETADAVVEKGDADAVAFGRFFVSNPDLPHRIKLGLPLNKYDPGTFYTFHARLHRLPFRQRPGRSNTHWRLMVPLQGVARIKTCGEQWWAIASGTFPHIVSMRICISGYKCMNVRTYNDPTTPKQRSISFDAFTCPAFPAFTSPAWSLSWL